MDSSGLLKIQYSGGHIGMFLYSRRMFAPLAAVDIQNSYGSREASNKAMKKQKGCSISGK